MSEVKETMYFYFIEETTQLLEAFIINPNEMRNGEIQEVAHQIRSFIESEYSIWLNSQLQFEIKRFKEHRRMSISGYMVKRLEELLKVGSSMAVVFAKIVLIDKLAYAMSTEIRRKYPSYPEGSYYRCCWNMVIPAYRAIVNKEALSIIEMHSNDFWYTFKDQPKLLENMLFDCRGFTGNPEKYGRLIRSPGIPQPKQAHLIIDESEEISLFKDYFCPEIIEIN
jgi:hypothetical protein